MQVLVKTTELALHDLDKYYKVRDTPYHNLPDDTVIGLSDSVVGLQDLDKVYVVTTW